MKTWKDYPEQTHPELTRWIESSEGDIISVVTGNSKGNMRIGIDGEMRCSIGVDCFSIPCSLSVVSKMSNSEVVKVAERQADRRKRYDR